MIRRKVGTAGRMVIPIEMLEFLGVKIGDYVDFTVEDGRICLNAVKEHCAFCYGKEQLRSYKEGYICPACAAAVAKAVATGEPVDNVAEDICTLMEKAVD